MKKLKVLLICIIIIILSILYIDNNNEKYQNNIENNIKIHTKIKNIKYINTYDKYYIVINNKYLYLINNKYKIIDKIDSSQIHINNKNYDIIYHNKKFMYLNNYIDKSCIIYEYYDIYTYELINKISLGG